MDATAILKALRLLPQEGRLEVLWRLWDEMLDEGRTPTLDDEQKAELDARWARFQADPSTGLTWDQMVEGVRRTR